MNHPAVILHHYASSPFCEKVRLALGLKGLAWGSVEVAPVPPRPLLDPLTGGYRRLPVLQIGADIYCDTNAIMPALERLRPEPTLYPGPSAGLVKALSFSFERAIWLAAIGVRVHFAAEDPPAAFLRDRKEDYLYIDMSKAAMEPDFGLNAQRVAAHVTWLGQSLSDGRAFLGGERAGALDLGFFHALWLIRHGNPADRIDPALGLRPILPWYERVAALGHGRPEPMSARAALAAARDADPLPLGASTPDAVFDLALGEEVVVVPDDFARVPVGGVLMATGPETITIRRDDPDLGALHLHFPRAGFELRASGLR